MITRLILIAVIVASPIYAHDGHNFSLAPEAEDAPLPLNLNIGGPFALTNQYGETRTQVDPEGRLQLLFFGYAKCAGICPIAMASMAEATDLLAKRGIKVRPVLITVDPANDTIEALGPAMAAISPEFIGLTGSQEALEQAYNAFHVESRKLFDTPEGDEVYGHGGYIYLLDGVGDLRAIFPPVLPPDRMADIVIRYGSKI